MKNRLTVFSVERKADDTWKCIFSTVANIGYATVGQSSEKHVLQFKYVPLILIKTIDIFLQCCCHTNNSSNVLSSRTQSVFLRSSVCKRQECRALPNIQEANTFRAIKLMSRRREHIYTKFIYIYIDVTNGLHRIRVK